MPLWLVLTTALLALPIQAAGRFDRSFERQGVRFHVTSANVGSVNRLRIVPGGRLQQRDPIEQEVFGTVTGAEVADLDADGWPEIYVYVISAGSGSYGTVVGYAVNHGKSLSAITLPELMEDPTAAKGYQGHDEFRVMKNSLVRRFPVYREGDSNATPSGDKRQLHYRLTAGEAGWRLVIDQVKSLALEPARKPHDE